MISRWEGSTLQLCEVIILWPNLSWPVACLLASWKHRKDLRQRAGILEICWICWVLETPVGLLAARLVDDVQSLLVQEGGNHDQMISNYIKSYQILQYQIWIWWRSVQNYSDVFFSTHGYPHEPCAVSLFAKGFLPGTGVWWSWRPRATEPIGDSSSKRGDVDPWLAAGKWACF